MNEEINDLILSALVCQNNIGRACDAQFSKRCCKNGLPSTGAKGFGTLDYCRTQTRAKSSCQNKIGLTLCNFKAESKLSKLDTTTYLLLGSNVIVLFGSKRIFFHTCV